MPVPVLETKRLFIRPFQKEDIDQVIKQYEDDIATKFYSGGIKTLLEVKAYLKQTINYFEKNQPLGRRAIVLKDKDLVIGHCGVDYLPYMFKEKIELSYGLIREYWNNGYASEAAMRMLQYFFDDLGFDELVAAINPKNRSSIKVIEKLGFSYYMDIDWPSQGEVYLYRIIK